MTTTEAPAPPQVATKQATPSRARAPRRAPRDHFTPLYGNQVFAGSSFAKDNTKESFLLYFMLLHRANVCGIVNFLPEHDHKVYADFLTPEEAIAAFDLLVEKRYLVHDKLRHVAFVRSHLKWDLRPLKNSKIFKNYITQARLVMSDEIKYAMAVTLAGLYTEEGVPPTVQALAPALLEELLGPNADEVLRNRTVASAAEWGELDV